MSRILATVLLLAASALAFAGPRALVSVNAATTVDADQIHLGDIARLSGDDATATRLKDLSLGYAPAIGAEREIQRSYLVMAIAAAGVAENAYALEIPERVA